MLYCPLISLMLIIGSIAADASASSDSIRFQAEPTAFYVERDGDLRQVVALDIRAEQNGLAGALPVKRGNRCVPGWTCVDTQTPFAAATTVTGWAAYGEKPGTIQLRIFRPKGANILLVGTSPTEKLAVGVNHYTLPEPIPVEAGDCVGFFVDQDAAVAESPRGGKGLFQRRDANEQTSSSLTWSRGNLVHSVCAFDDAGATSPNDFAALLAEGSLTVESPLEKRTARIADLDAIGDYHFLDVTPVDKPTDVTITLTHGATKKTITVTVKPERKWKMYIFHSLHVDIGYTDQQEAVARKLARNMDTFMGFCEEDQTYPPGAKPVWNCEVAWTVDEYQRLRTSAQWRRFLHHIREGDIAVQAIWANMLSGACDAEELCRLLYFTRGLERDYGIPIRSAMQTDTPNYTYAYPTMLAGAGIRYLSVGQNGGVVDRRPNVNPFYWVGPDGSEVLVWHSREYARSTSDKLHWQHIEDRLRQAEKESTACDAIGSHGLYSDNFAITDAAYWPQIRVIEEWNKRFAYPKLILATPFDMLKYVEENFADSIPRLRGDWGSDWEDGIASSADETGINRIAKSDLFAAEALATIATLDPSAATLYPKKQIDDALRNVMLYDEHVWGAYSSVNKPEGNFTLRQWAQKEEFARAALDSANSLAYDMLAAATAGVPTSQGTTIAVFNPTSWTRTGVASLPLPQEWVDDPTGITVFDNVTRQAAPCQIEGRSLVFLAPDVPSVGYKTFQLARTAIAQLGTVAVNDNTIENRFFRVTLDPATGAIASIYDKQLDKELVDASSPYKFNQYIYDDAGVQGMPWRRSGKVPVQFDKVGPTGIRIERGHNGALRTGLVSIAKGPMTPEVRQEIFLYGDLKRIDLVNHLKKDNNYEPEQVYYAFPFAVATPSFLCELPGSIINAQTGRFDCADKNWFAIQSFVDVANDDYGVTWASLEAPLVTFNAPANKWVDGVNNDNATFLSYIMTNVWITNYKAGQSGDFTFRYSLTTHDGPTDRLAATRFGAEWTTPLLACILPKDQRGALPADQHSFLTVNGDGVVLQAFKRAEDARGVIVRLRSVADADSQARIRMADCPFKQAALTDIVERDQQRLVIDDDEVVAVPVRAGGMATIRLW